MPTSTIYKIIDTHLLQKWNKKTPLTCADILGCNKYPHPVTGSSGRFAHVAVDTHTRWKYPPSVGNTPEVWMIPPSVGNTLKYEVENDVPECCVENNTPKCVQILGHLISKPSQELRKQPFTSVLESQSASQQQPMSSNFRCLIRGFLP